MTRNKKWRLGLLGFGLYVAATPISVTSAAEPNPPAHACDDLAGDPNDALRVSPGTYVREINYEKAFAACSEAIAAYPDSARLQYHMGRVLHRKDDYYEAAIWYRKAADQGYAPAMSILGVFYAAGGGVGRDYREAVRWYKKAVAGGHKVAMHNLAIRYTDGRGIAVDFDEAIKLFRKAASLGYAASLEALALVYLKDRDGIKKDPVEAVKWLRKAAAKGRKDAMYFLARAFEKGEGIDRAPEQAGYWFTKAIEKGSDLALNHITRGHDTLSPETRRAIQKTLTDTGHFKGTVDGTFGDDTLAAIEKLSRTPNPPQP